jgi:hypothetical protein
MKLTCPGFIRKSRVFILPFFMMTNALSTAAFAERPYQLPEQAAQIAKDVYLLGIAQHNGKPVIGYSFIHHYHEFAKPEKPGRDKGGRGNGGGKGGGKNKGSTGGGDNTSSCYAFINGGVKWNSAENYIVDPSNQSGMSNSFVYSNIAAATTAWNKQVSGNIFGSRISGTVDGADTASPDNKNEVYFAEINESGVIAVTNVWFTYTGVIVEWDQVYDDIDFAWGNADTNTGVMDLLNIAAHEVGHAAGMNHPDSSCIVETMYAYASAGETKKRDLNTGDIAGIQALY